MGNHRADHRGSRRLGGSTSGDAARPVGGKRAARPEPRRRATTVERSITPETTTPATTTPATPSAAVPAVATPAVATPATVLPRHDGTRFEDTTLTLPAVTASIPTPTTYDVRGYAAQARAEAKAEARAQTAAARATEPGRRRAVKEPKPAATGTGFRLPVRPSGPVLAGVAVLAISTGGALTAGGAGTSTDVDQATTQVSASGAMSGTTVASSGDLLTERNRAVSRDSQRDALEDATVDEAQLQQTEAMAERRATAMSALGQAAQAEAQRVAANAWVLPVASYRLTNRFGQAESYYASGYHTGLDFAAPSGTTIKAVAGGRVTQAGYNGSYGNKTVITLDDGTEMWYAHQSSIAVSVGDTVAAGDVIGYVGSTGNSTGPHLHLEVRPGAGDPVDPYAALQQNGVTP
ncbi:M23 family metallopeptidase [Nocardioides zeae]|nr:M23 family metallopeptidase [Nocardioides zeae]